jgi:hypothetical protein
VVNAAHRVLSGVVTSSRQFVMEVYAMMTPDPAVVEELRRKIYILVAFIRLGCGGGGGDDDDDDDIPGY